MTTETKKEKRLDDTVFAIQLASTSGIKKCSICGNTFYGDVGPQLMDTRDAYISIAGLDGCNPVCSSCGFDEIPHLSEAIARYFEGRSKETQLPYCPKCHGRDLDTSSDLDDHTFYCPDCELWFWWE
jgi:hypothetical protein